MFKDCLKPTDADEWHTRSCATATPPQPFLAMACCNRPQRGHSLQTAPPGCPKTREGAMCRPVRESSKPITCSAKARLHSRSDSVTTWRFANERQGKLVTMRQRVEALPSLRHTHGYALPHIRMLDSDRKRQVALALARRRQNALEQPVRRYRHTSSASTLPRATDAPVMRHVVPRPWRLSFQRSSRMKFFSKLRAMRSKTFPLSSAF